MESIGVYLPPKSVTTKEIVKGCKRRLLLPLQRLTGIESRRMAGDGEFGYDLAVKAIDNCLAHSKYEAGDIDCIVSCNISHFDAPDEFSFEPSRAVRLRKTFGMHDALAFDITNACAGMFTGIYIVESLIRAGAIRRGLVVSGEYITPLTRTAQQEIKGVSDPRLACLTLGDAGAAVIVDAAPPAETNGDAESETQSGFHALDLYTMGRHSPLCIAKLSEQPHGGAIMTTDMINLANIAVPAFLQHAALTVFKLGWSSNQVDHIVPHQTSKTTLEAGPRAARSTSDARRLEFKDKTINIVANRGNTATTSHFVALRDCFLDGKIQSGQSVVFGILASGITVGTAVYRFDDLPASFKHGESNGARNAVIPRPEPKVGTFVNRGLRPRIRIESLGALGQDRGKTDSFAMLTEASQTCLDASAYAPNDVDLVLSSGVYRTGYVSEPAIAGGFLNACHLASAFLRSGARKRALIVASEVETNAKVAPDRLRGIQETAGAVMLDVSDDTGFEAFVFKFFPDEAEAMKVRASTRAAQEGERWITQLIVEKDPELESRLSGYIAETVDELLSAEGITRDDLAVVLPPQISTEFITDLAETLKLDRDRFVDVSRAGGDLFTSSIPHGFAQLMHGDSRPAPGSLGLVVSVAAGLEIGCALYRF
jgi:3-oxoacyl-[acyl-carrier-protein] synthase III